MANPIAASVVISFINGTDTAVPNAALTAAILANACPANAVCTISLLGAFNKL